MRASTTTRAQPLLRNAQCRIALDPDIFKHARTRARALVDMSPTRARTPHHMRTSMPLSGWSSGARQVIRSPLWPSSPGRRTLRRSGRRLQRSQGCQHRHQPAHRGGATAVRSPWYLHAFARCSPLIIRIACGWCIPEPRPGSLRPRACCCVRCSHGALRTVLIPAPSNRTVARL